MEKYAPAAGTTNRRTRSLGFRSIFMHAWDLADHGVEDILRWAAEAGLNTLCVAGTYHSGWFLHPHHSRHRAFMTEGSVAYFRPQTALWKKAKLRPKLAQLCAKKDWLLQTARRADEFGLRLVSWTVGTHNSRLGSEFPQFTQQNVYGDRLPFALCPANPEVREYLGLLCRDLATNYHLWGIQLEGFGWMSHAHGHHHERDLVGLTPFEQTLMSLCFCPVCCKVAGRDVDIEQVKSEVKSVLDGVFREAPGRPKHHPRSMAELEHRSSPVKKFNAWRKAFSNKLIRELKTHSLAGTDCRLLVQTGVDADLADAVDGFACFAFGTSPSRTSAICKSEGVTVPENWNGIVQCCIQLGCGVPTSEKQLFQIVQAVAASGCNGINFYNYSESPPKMLAWLAGVLPKFAH